MQIVIDSHLPRVARNVSVSLPPHPAPRLLRVRIADSGDIFLLLTSSRDRTVLATVVMKCLWGTHQAEETKLEAYELVLQSKQAKTKDAYGTRIWNEVAESTSYKVIHISLCQLHLL